MTARVGGRPRRRAPVPFVERPRQNPGRGAGPAGVRVRGSAGARTVGLTAALAAGLSVALAAGPVAVASRAGEVGGSGAEADVEEAVRAYVDLSREVRQAQAKVDAARLQYRKLVEVAAAPALSVSTGLGWSADEGPAGLASASPDSAAVATLTWSPVPPLTLTGRLQLSEGARSLRGLTGSPEDAAPSGQGQDVATVEAAWSLWPPAGATDRSLKAEQARLDLLDAERAARAARRQAAIDGRLWYARVQVRAARLEVARRDLDSALGQVDRTLAQFRAGFVGEDAVLQARASAQKAAAAVQEAAGALRAAEQALGRPADRISPLPTDAGRVAYARRAAAEALGFTQELVRSLLSGEQSWPPEASGAVGVVLDVPALPEALKQRVVESSPELALARLRLELARRQLEAVRANWGSASLSASTEVPVRRDGGGGGSPSTWSVGFSARLALLDGGARRADEAEARRSLEEAGLAVADAARAVADELESRWHAVGQAALNLLAARVALDQAVLRQAVVEARAGQGAASPAELDEARRALDRAALDLVEAAATLRAEAERLQARVDGGRQEDGGL